MGKQVITGMCIGTLQLLAKHKKLPFRRFFHSKDYIASAKRGCFFSASADIAKASAFCFRIATVS